jgi:hypothetical protein
MNERHDATTSNSSMHERVEFLISTNRQLQMPRRDTLTRGTFDALPSQTHQHMPSARDANDTHLLVPIPQR